MRLRLKGVGMQEKCSPILDGDRPEACPETPDTVYRRYAAGGDLFSMLLYNNSLRRQSRPTPPGSRPTYMRGIIEASLVQVRSIEHLVTHGQPNIGFSVTE